MAKRRFFRHLGITFSGVDKTINCLVFLVVLLAEASLEPKNTFQLRLSPEISQLESGADAKCPKVLGTEELRAYLGTTAGVKREK